MPYRGKVDYAHARKRVARAQHTALSPGALAHLDLGLVSRTRTVDLPALCARLLTAEIFSPAHPCARGTGSPGLRGLLPGFEPRPYILRFDEDRPNPLYRRVCYTFAWNAVLSFALLNLAGLAIAAFTGVWYMKQIYSYAYLPLCAVILLLGVLGKLPRVGPSTRAKAPSAATSTARCGRSSLRRNPPCSSSGRSSPKPPPAVSHQVGGVSTERAHDFRQSPPRAASCPAPVPSFPANSWSPTEQPAASSCQSLILRWPSSIGASIRLDPC